MKIFKLFLPLVFLSVFNSCEPNSLNIEVNLENLNSVDSDGWAKIMVRDSIKWNVMDSVLLKEGMGKLSFSPESPTSFYLSIGGTDAIAGFGFRGNLELTGDASIVPFQGKLEGMKDQDDLNSFMKESDDFREFRMSLNDTWTVASAANDSLTLDSLSFLMDDRYAQLQKKTKVFALSHQELGVYIAIRYLGMESVDFIDSVLAMVEGRKSADIDILQKRSEALHRVAIGQPYTDLIQQDTSGTPMAISSIKSDYILVDFWASWCGPCRAQNPSLVKLYSKWNNSLEIIGVAFDQDENRWKKAIIEDGLLWHQMSDLKGWGNAAADAYSIRAIPQNILIGPEGTIIKRNIEPEQLDEYLKMRLLDK